MAISTMGKRVREHWLIYAQLLVSVLLGTATLYVALVANKTSDAVLDAIENIEATSVYEVVVRQYTHVKGTIPTDGGWKDAELIEQCESDLRSITTELKPYETFSLTKQLLVKVSDEISDKVCGVAVDPNASQHEPSQDQQDAYPYLFERICLNEMCTRWIIP